MKTQIQAGIIGQTITPMKPAGRVKIEGAVYDGRSDGSWIDSDRPVVVTRADNFGLVVREVLPGQPLFQASEPAPPPPSSPPIITWLKDEHRGQQRLTAGFGIGLLLGLLALLVRAALSAWDPGPFPYLFAVGGGFCGTLAVYYLEAVCSLQGPQGSEAEIPTVQLLYIPVTGGLCGAALGFWFWGVAAILPGLMVGALALAFILLVFASIL